VVAPSQLLWRDSALAGHRRDGVAGAAGLAICHTGFTFFVALLLTKISGIPLLEKAADEKWGGNADYEAYKRRTSTLLLLPPK